MPRNFSDSDQEHNASPAGPNDPHPPGRFNRSIGLYGESCFSRIRAARLAVIGLGGVGSHAVINLARSGVAGLLLIDFDTVTESSLNRFVVAGPDDVGRLKTEVLAEYLQRTCPDTGITTNAEYCSAENVGTLLSPVPDLVVDAIDSVESKVALIQWCVDHQVPVVSSMGAAGRRDFTQVRTGDVSATTVCPLARQVRLRLRQAGTTSGVQCVYSAEKANAVMEPKTSASPGCPDAVSDGDVPARPARRLASSTTMPGIFGYALAELALTNIINRPYTVSE